MKKLLYSLIVPVYKNEANLPSLLVCMAEISKALNHHLEVVFVVDGSPDQCYPILKEKLPWQPYPSQLLLHSRNYGSFAAIRTGMKSMRGQYMAMMAADLQEPPEMIIEFFRILETDEADVVLGARDSRNDPWLSKLSAQFFWLLYKRLVIPDLPDGGVDVFGCNHAFRTELLGMHESNASLIGLIYWLGFRRKTVLYTRRQRVHGVSAWTLSKKISYLADSIFAFSSLPIKALSNLGIFGFCIAVLAGTLIIILKLIGLINIPGYAATMLAILLFGSLNMIGIGIIGAYVWRSYGNTMARPLAVTMKHHLYDHQIDKYSS